MKHVAWVCALLVFTSGCRAIHEGSIRGQLLETRFAHTAFALTMPEVEQRLAFLPRQTLERGLWVSSEGPAATGGHTWCFAERTAHGCFTAIETKEGLVFSVDAPEPLPLIRVFWSILDLPGAQAAMNAPEDDVEQLVAQEEATFVPRWSFLGGGRTGAVTSFEGPAFTFGGQVGVRYWASSYVIPGLALEVENTLFQGGSVVTVAPQARVELSVWSSANSRFLNTPGLSFLMAIEPLVAFGQRPAVGARGVVGIHLVHLGRYYTPFFFEVGYQALVVDKREATGLRIAVGVGF